MKKKAGFADKTPVMGQAVNVLKYYKQLHIRFLSA
jgi:hypothetical protein